MQHTHPSHFSAGTAAFVRGSARHSSVFIDECASCGGDYAYISSSRRPISSICPACRKAERETYSFSLAYRTQTTRSHHHVEETALRLCV